jgi:hypothetical protein
VVTLDTNDPAYKLAEATQNSLKGGDVGAIDRVYKELKPTAETITRAYALCLINESPFSPEANRLILNALQNRLAEKTAHGLTVLTRWLVFLTVVLIGFGIFDVYMRLRGCG